MNTIKSIFSVAVALCLIAATAEAGRPQRMGGISGHTKAKVVNTGHGYRGGGARFGGGFVGGGFGGGFGYGNFGPVGGFSPYSTGRIPTPPYFALHPPVYYSAPVPRSYGYSPFAYPGSVRTPEVAVPQVQPQVIENQYCPAALKKLEQKEEAQKSDSDDFASTSQWIGNPFVRSIDQEAIQQAPVVVSN